LPLVTEGELSKLNDRTCYHPVDLRQRDAVTTKFAACRQQAMQRRFTERDLAATDIRLEWAVPATRLNQVVPSCRQNIRHWYACGRIDGLAYVPIGYGLSRYRLCPWLA